jgi:NAD-dependent SIR2 family protein deacetylase
MMTDPVDRIRAMFESADGLMITAGAGMGVDSGLPDFRSNNGFWKAYPALTLGGTGDS